MRRCSGRRRRRLQGSRCGATAGAMEDGHGSVSGGVTGPRIFPQFDMSVRLFPAFKDGQFVTDVRHLSPSRRSTARAHAASAKRTAFGGLILLEPSIPILAPDVLAADWISAPVRPGVGATEQRDRQPKSGRRHTRQPPPSCCSTLHFVVIDGRPLRLHGQHEKLASPLAGTSERQPRSLRNAASSPGPTSVRCVRRCQIPAMIGCPTKIRNSRGQAGEWEPLQSPLPVWPS